MKRFFNRAQLNPEFKLFQRLPRLDSERIGCLAAAAEVSDLRIPPVMIPALTEPGGTMRSSGDTGRSVIQCANSF